MHGYHRLHSYEGQPVNEDLVQAIDGLIGKEMLPMPGVSRKTFHHVGIAVLSIRSAALGIARTFGLRVDSPILTDPVQQVAAMFLIHPVSGYRVELIEPAGGASPIRRFLQKTGGGLHHLCFESPDLEAELLRMKAGGARVVCPPVEACGFRGTRIAFCYTRERLLVELAETPVVYDQVGNGNEV